MSSNVAEIATQATLASNPLDVIPNEMPFDVSFGLPISLDRAKAVIQAAVAEAKKRKWKMNIAVRPRRQAHGARRHRGQVLKLRREIGVIQEIECAHCRRY
jgi:hypothetical protein